MDKYWITLLVVLFSNGYQSIAKILEANNKGNWSIVEDIIERGICNIDVIDGSKLTQDQFLQWYAYRSPVVIKGATNNEEFRNLCSRDHLLEEYGDKQILLSSANTHSYSKRKVSLTYYLTNVLKPQAKDALGNETWYWFGDNNHTEWHELFDKYVLPPFTLPNMTPVLSFGVAGGGTGVPFHFHGPGFAEVIYGQKRWFMYPPDVNPYFHPNHTTLQWLREDYPNLHLTNRPLDCTIGPGEIIYFPEHWWHGTLNLETSVFISTFLG